MTKVFSKLIKVSSPATPALHMFKVHNKHTILILSQAQQWRQFNILIANFESFLLVNSCSKLLRKTQNIYCES